MSTSSFLTAAELNAASLSVPALAADPPGRFRIAGKTAVVTGAGSGIGRAVAEELVKRGARIVGLVDCNEEGIFNAAQRLKGQNGTEQVCPFAGDVTDKKFCQLVFDELTARGEGTPPAICVPAAGVSDSRLAVQYNHETGDFDVYDEAKFDQVMQVNLKAPIFWILEMIRRVAMIRRERELKKWTPQEPIRGAGIFIGSVCSLGNKGLTAYGSSKAGLAGAAATMALEAIFHGVRCGIVHPGYTDTPMIQKLGKEYLDKSVIPRTSQKRLLQPDEVADAIRFYIENTAITGPLFVDAGFKADV